MADLAVVVVTYQSAGHIENCLTALAVAAQGLTWELVIVDNGSTDATLERVRDPAPHAHVIAGQGNVGFARGCNRGAAASGARHVLFLNPDTEVRPGTLHALLDAAREFPGAGLYGGRTLRADGRVEDTCAQGEMTVWSLTCFATGLSSAFARSPLFDPESLGTWARDTAREVPVLSGAVLMVARHAWERLQGFDERYFMYAEDADLCKRARDAGYSPRLVPAAEAVHHVGGSSTSGDKQVLLHKGKATYVRLRWSPPARSYGLVCLWLGVALRARLAGRLGTGDDSRRRTDPSAWQAAWIRRAEWLPGW